MKKILSIIIANILLLGCMQAFATTEEMQAWKYNGEFHLSDTADILKDNGIYFSNSSSIDFYEEYALQQSCHYLHIDTNERNATARQFYRNRGYREIGVCPCDFNGLMGVRLVLLEKKI